MKLLALDTSTDQLSLAVSVGTADPARTWTHTGAGGAQASATLVPAIEALMAQGGLTYAQLDAIAFGQGPGSFTGLRTACAVAQGLGWGAGVPLLPVPTLLAVAETARLQRAQPGPWRVLALLDARMDELYAAHYAFDGQAWTLHDDYQLLRPEQLQVLDSEALAGNVFEAYGARLPVAADLPRWTALPTATALLSLAPALLAAGQAVAAADALPRYVRDKVAKTTLEREAEKAAAR